MSGKEFAKTVVRIINERTGEVYDVEEELYNQIRKNGKHVTELQIKHNDQIVKILMGLFRELTVSPKLK